MNDKRKSSKNPKDSGRRAETARGIRITVEMAAFVVLAVYLAGYTYSMLSKPKIGTETVAYGQIDVPRQFDGLILRDETVTYAHEAGTVYYSYGENEYVKTGSVVCVIKDGDAASGYEKEIEAISDDILNRHALNGDNPAQAEEVNRLNMKMRTDVSRSIPLLMSAGNKESHRLKSMLVKDIEARNNIILSDSGESYSTLMDRKNAFERRLDEATSAYSADECGIMSYVVDGLESTASPENMMNITRAAIEAPITSLTMGERHVESGSPLFKIVTSNTWYMCAYLDNELVLDWDEGTSRPIYFLNGSDVNKVMMEVVKIAPDGDKTYAVFSSSKYLPDFINERQVKFSLEEDTYRGLKIPNTAIVEKTALMLPPEYVCEQRGMSGVYIKDNSGYSFKQVSVLSKNDEEAWILQNFDIVKLGDTVYAYADGHVVEESGYNIERIKTSPGIYVANSGSAEFKLINIVKRNDYFAIIEKDTGVKSYDTIISDAGPVNDNQIIR